MNRFGRTLGIALMIFGATITFAQTQSPAKKFKDEMRMPWVRGSEDYIRLWLIAGPFDGSLDTDCIKDHGGEASLQPTDGLEQRRSDGTAVRWHSLKSWGDESGFDDLAGPREGRVAYAFARITRSSAGPAMLSIGSLNGIRVWVNGKLALSRDGLRALTADEDQTEIQLKAGDNNLLLKAPADGRFYVRVLEAGTVFSRKVEFGPSLIKLSPEGFTLKTDINGERADADAVSVEVIRPGGTVVYSTSAPRGATIDVDAQEWADGPYEVRCTSRTSEGLLFAAHLPWYKGDFLPKAKELAETAAVADASSPEGFTLKMLSEMVEDRLGCKLSEVEGNPWMKVHSPLMEYEEMMLEREGSTGRIRPYGFVRLAYTDEVDGSPQFCRAYLPAEYDASKKWPLVIQIHGYNPANPVYVRWWSADQRHMGSDAEFSDHQGVIYVEPHGRGNTYYTGMGDSDIMHVIAEAKRLFNIDEDRIYLTGDSMGGWGTWNVATRHPDVFAAIAPVFGGSDYHSQMPEEDLAKLSPVERFLNEKGSSWALADALLNVPIFVHHGDVDQAVSVDYSRWGVRLLQRWGYDIRYHEYPGRSHEALASQNGLMNVNWFLQHRRNSDPRHVRIRSAELRHASAYWVHALQAASPLEFMVVDAQIIDRNVIRLDSDNILEIELSPSSVLVDPEKPITVVWNGDARERTFEAGKLRLTAPEYMPASIHKDGALPGTMTDFTVTPFAVVIGTVSRDTAMRSLCREKANAFIAAWETWQHHRPRVFEDTTISEEEMAEYSLLLVGGADENRVSSKLADRIPLRISDGQIEIDGKTFHAKDAALQMLYPNPLNGKRYLLVMSATSPEGMYFNDLNPQRLSPWDYVIADGRIPAFQQKASALQMKLVSGMFDYNWRYNGALAQGGDSTLRAKGRLRH
ncbi:MAG TPA: prolyl oligopeptidase family serine peptidase, partial [Bacteroidota bacterium]|nr:prolyl oligopeptidase family serine peptidase [Bacteroidota bacterium]